jgi:transcriptional regulator with XRE-family HTH domain
MTNVTIVKERLAELMKAYGLTAGRFAEALGVQASSISHLLSGRNNPNFDFLVKLFERFPDINPDWFLRGEGKMLRSGGGDARPDLFSGTKKAPEASPVKEAWKDRSMVGRLAVDGKTISRIIVFYSDGTFSSFQEE